MIDLSQLDDDQRAAATAPPGPLLIAAGAGSGKTRVLTYRIAHQIESGVADPARFFVSAFTKAASKEMEDRLAKLVPGRRVRVATFHSHMYGLLCTDRVRPKVCSDSERNQIIKGLLGAPSRGFPKTLNVEVDAALVAKVISGWKNNLIPHDDEQVHHAVDNEDVSTGLGAAARIYPLYEDHLLRQAKIDFDDMLKVAYERLVSSPERLAAVQRKWTSFFVDEYQDTNSAQVGILTLLAPPATHPNFTVVGDDKQAIFRFRGSRPESFNGFTQRWKGANRIDLVRNYRSTPEVVRVANQLMDPAEHAPQVSVRPAGPRTKVALFESQEEQAVEIARFVAAAQQAGHPPSDVAVLFRTRAQTASVEQAFVLAGLPYHVDGGGFFDRAEVGDLMAYLRLCNDPNDEKSLRRIINRPTRYLGAAFCDAVVADAKRCCLSLISTLPKVEQTKGKKLGPNQRAAAAWLRQLIVQINGSSVAMQNEPVDAIDTVLTETKYLDWLQRESGTEEGDDSRLENISMLKEIAFKYKTIAEFIDFADQTTKAQKETGTEFSTIHRAKGREWPYVVVSNFHDESLPHKRAVEETHGIEDERRLAYVAMTRASDCLLLAVPEVSNFGVPVGPSRYLEEAKLDLDEVTDRWWGDAFLTPTSTDDLVTQFAGIAQGMF